MHPLERHTFDVIRRDRLVRSGDAMLVVAVSGGPDSVALLHVLAGLRTTLGVALHAVIVDHGLRPREVAGEIELVRSLAEQLGTGFEVVRVAAREKARRAGLSLEHAARELRYEALRKEAARIGAAGIAVAHTADDQVEEILIRMLRGGGTMALSGMRTRSGDLLRPFLETGKKDVLAYLADRNLGFCTDSSNADMRFLRNRVRHRLLPYLEQHFDAGVRSALRKAADCLAEDEALLTELTDAALAQVIVTTGNGERKATPAIRLRRLALAAKPRALQRRILERLLWQMGGRASHAQILRIMAAAQDGVSGSELHLPGGLRLGVQRDYLDLLYPEGRKPWRGRLYPRSGDLLRKRVDGGG